MTKKCRIYAACGVSQTPNMYNKERSFSDHETCKNIKYKKITEHSKKRWMW